MTTQTLTVTGAYTLLIEGAVGNTGPVGYGFNVQKVTNTTAALTLGAQVDGAISQTGQQNLYTFTLANASQLYFDSLTNDSTFNWTLTGPRGTEINARSFQSSDADSLSLSNPPALNLIAGSYTLAVAGIGDRTGSYGFRLLDLASAPAVATGSNNGGQNGSGDITVTTDNHSTANAINLDGQFALTSNPDISNSTTIPHVSIHATGAGAFDYYKFTVATGGTTGIFDIDHASWDTYLNLFDSSGTRLAFNDDGGADPGSTSGNNSFLTYTFATAGTYYIQAAQYPNAAISTGNAYVLQVSLQVPPNASSLNPGNETDAYRFNVTAGERYFFDVQSVSAGSTDWRLIDPYGQQVWYNSFDDVATQTLTVTGAYTLLIEGAIGNTSPIGYGFNVQKVTNTTAALTMGAQVDGAVTQTGQQNIYTFTLANASQLYFDSLTNDSNFTWTLTGPRGTEVNARSFQSSDAGNFGSSNPVLNLIAGSYTLAVAGTADGTGSYSFRLSDLSTAGMVTPGTPISGTLNPGAATNVYRINVSAGDLFYFDQQSQTSGSNLYWRLIDPFGSQVWSNSFSDVSTQALAFTGSYALLVEGGIGNTSQVSYTFNAQKVTNTTSALTLGTQVNGAIAQAGQQNFYTFTLANAGLLYFDSLTNDGSLNWTPHGSPRQRSDGAQLHQLRCERLHHSIPF